MITFSLLSLEDERLDFFRKNGLKAITTDYAMLCGCYSNRSIGGYWMENPSYELGALIMGYTGYHISKFPKDIDGGFRPIISYDSITDFGELNYIEENGRIIIEYGYYPQNIVDAKLQRKLSKWQEGKEILQKKPIESFEIKNDLGTTKIYKYKNEFYALAINHQNSEIRLSDGSVWIPGDRAWVKLAPIRWLKCDEKRLISEKVLFSGVSFNDKGRYDCKFDKTNAYIYLNNVFARDIHFLDMLVNGRDNIVSTSEKNTTIRYSENGVILNEKSQKINDIVNEIYGLLESYYGDDDILKQVDELIENYNKDLKQVYDNKDSGIVLSTTNQDKNTLYLKLINELETILSKLKLSSEKYSEYFKMLQLTRNCLNILNDNEVAKDVKDDLIDDIVTIKQIVLPFINDDEKLTMIKDVFLEEEKNITSYLKGNADSIIKECNSLDDFKLKIRKKLQTCLIDLNLSVKNKDLVNELKEEYIKVASGLFSQEKNDYINRFLGEINKLISLIKENGTEEEKDRLNEILSEDVKFNDDMIDSIKKVKDLYVKIYGIVLDIQERETTKREFDEYTITIDKSKLNK